jgi:hypothetical protein
MLHSTRTGRRAAVGLAVAILVASAGPAQGASGTAERGSCSGHSNWKFKADPSDGRLDLEGEVDSDRAHQKWHWKILHDGWVSFHGTAWTHGGGSFTVQRRVVDSAGTDHLGWRASNRKTGEKCRGRLII